LDLTGNSLDLAGVMALSVGLKMNQVMRCLDVNVPPNDVEMARLSREILRSCVRNTERVAGVTITGEPLPPDYGEGSSSLSEGLDGILGAGARGGVWGLIERSELARVVKQDVERERVGEEKRELQSLGGKQKLDVWRKTPSEVVKASRQLVNQLSFRWCHATRLTRICSQLHDAHEAGPENVETLLERSHALVGVLVEMVQVEKEPERLEELLSLNDQLTSLVKNLVRPCEVLRKTYLT
jgi:protein phosphatase 1 regulatory subunit 37